MNTKQVKVYSTATCHYCHVIKEFLSSHKIEFTEIHVDTDMNAAMAMITMTGQRGVPVVQIDEEFVVGADIPWVSEKLGIVA